MPLDESRISDAGPRDGRQVRRLRQLLRKSLEVNSVGNKHRVWVDAALFFEHSQGVQEDLIYVTDQLSFDITQGELNG